MLFQFRYDAANKLKYWQINQCSKWRKGLLYFYKLIPDHVADLLFKLTEFLFISNNCVSVDRQIYNNNNVWCRQELQDLTVSDVTNRCSTFCAKVLFPRTIILNEMNGGKGKFFVNERMGQHLGV